MAELSHYTMKTLAAAAGGLNLPTLPVTAAYVRACDGNVAEWEDRWHRLADAIQPAKGNGNSNGKDTTDPGHAADGPGRGNASDAADDDARRDTAARKPAREPVGQRAPRPSQVASPRPAREGPSAPDLAPPPQQRPDQVYVITSAAPRRPHR
jgi:hypothetical protein